jgi:hypothetical protein
LAASALASLKQFITIRKSEMGQEKCRDKNRGAG